MNIIVVGNGMVGFKMLEKLSDAAREHATELSITTFAEEPRPAYDRVHLSEYFSGRTAAELSLAPLAWYGERDIDLRLGDKVIAIDRASKSVETRSGETLNYDKLILATGSYPFVPPIDGIDKDGVFVYRTIEDLDKTILYAKSCQTAAVIGGGLLGLEAANALINLNLNTHVVEFAPRLMPRQIDQTGSDLLSEKIAGLGVQVHTNRATQAILGNGRVTGMAFKDGSELAVDLIVVSAGIRARDELARTAELDIGERGGVVVDEHMQTSDPDIYAVGECAAALGVIYGLVAPGYRMAETAAQHILGQQASFVSADTSTKLKLMGVDVASIGQSTREDDCKVTSLATDGVYKKLILTERF